MMTRTLDQWIEYIQTLHHRQIDLSLERVAQVFERLAPDGVPFNIVSISGTNGKGSTAELLASIYRAAGYQVGKYTSPHLIRFNERVSLNGLPIDDESLLASFEHIEKTRGDTPITFFEFGTLIAIDLFIKADLDIAIMEVGLGGRLDAVNILDADVAVVTSLSLDHTAWLGNSIDEIAYEKSGIARAGKPCLVGFNSPPKTLAEHCAEIGATLKCRGDAFDYSYSEGDHVWQFVMSESVYDNLPLPFGQAGVQLSNAALAVQVTQELQQELPMSQSNLQEGLQLAAVQGRCQIVQRQPLVVLDVSHNQDSVARLSTFISDQGISGRIVAACGMLKDKDIGASLAQISDLVDDWVFASIENERGATAQELKSILLNGGQDDETSVQCFESITDAYKAGIETLTADDCLVVFGSFFIAGDILRMLKQAPDL